ncbi:PAAR domain-containing protein [Burkholderia vietnamiensis]|uniref:PAAR domain-containing protein n=1 Tax=Burkholderia vietnamiensis TaxID=60552 RepID=UPI001B962261|nr:PAAR domain-containing protein [Burkholderia vietnamiensis]MBR7976763.1 PAAR domain-containing protein [Burkholderia vietnamiensis]
MSKAPVRYGDTTTHGGHVSTASSTLIIDGRACALRDDHVQCPEHGTVRIVDGDDGYIENGRPLGVHRCRTSCGAEVLESTHEFGA